VLERYSRASMIKLHLVSSLIEQGGMYNAIILTPQEELKLKSAHTTSTGVNFEVKDTWKHEIEGRFLTIIQLPPPRVSLSYQYIVNSFTGRIIELGM